MYSQDGELECAVEGGDLVVSGQGGEPEQTQPGGGDLEHGQGGGVDLVQPGQGEPGLAGLHGSVGEQGGGVDLWQPGQRGVPGQAEFEETL